MGQICPSTDHGILFEGYICPRLRSALDVSSYHVSFLRQRLLRSHQPMVLELADPLHKFDSKQLCDVSRIDLMIRSSLDCIVVMGIVAPLGRKGEGGSVDDDVAGLAWETCNELSRG